MEARMTESPITGLFISGIIAGLAFLIPLPLDPTQWPPGLWWIVKAAGGVILVESLRRGFIILVLDRFFPDRAAAARLTWYQRWRERNQRTDLDLKD